MPPIKNVSPLFDICLKRLRMSLFKTWKLRYFKNYIGTFGKRKDEWRNMLSKHIYKNLIAPIRNLLLNDIMYQVLHSKFNGFLDLYSPDNEDIESEVPGDYCIFHRIPDLVRDFLLILTSEGIKELDLRHDAILESYYGDSEDLLGNISCGVLTKILSNADSFAKGLTSLNLEYATDADLVRIIGLNCQNLQFLNIESFHEPDEKMVDSLHWLYESNPVDNPLGCPKLQTLILPRCKRRDVAITHVLQMVLYMPNLCYVRNVDTRLVLQRYIKEIMKSKPLKLVELEEWPPQDGSYESDFLEYHFTEYTKVLPNLKSYKSYTGLFLTKNFHRLSNLISSFNNIQQLVLCEDTFNTFEFDLNKFPYIPSLKVLVLDINEENVILEQIQSLSLSLPNLQELEIGSCGLFDFMESAKKENGILFEHLKSLNLYKVMEMDNEFLIEFLERCPNLTCLSILVCNDYAMGENLPVTSAMIEEIKGSMQNLERISIARDFRANSTLLDLTRDDVLTLVDACPKLKFLGKIDTWYVTEQEAQDLIAICKKENWDLHLSYAQSNRGSL